MLVDQKVHWQELLKTINTEHVPLNCVKKVIFKLAGGKQKTVNLEKLRKEGIELEEIGAIISTKMISLSTEIVDMDYVIDVDSVRQIIQPITDELLNNI